MTADRSRMLADPIKKFREEVSERADKSDIVISWIGGRKVMAISLWTS